MRVCLIGSNGYIGSCLRESLKKYELTCVDRKQEHYEESFIRSFEVILYFGGKSSRQMREEESYLNTDEIVTIAKMMNPEQLLIYASTSAILEGHQNADEDQEVFPEEVYPKSMLQRERLIKALPVRSVGLRLGSVIGLSAKQRSDRLHIQMLKSALFTGRIHVYHPFSERPIISMKDLVRGVDHLLEKSEIFSSGEIFNLAAYNTTVQAVASNISLKTGAKIIYHETNNQNLKKGFSVNSKRFQERLNFSFLDDDSSIMDELLNHKSELLESWKNPVKKTTPCFVCGNDQLIEMVDLGNQPLANQFTQEKIICQEYPLAMFRCPNCEHNQLGHIIPPEELFSDYIYVTGTTKTMDDYCESFAQKVSAIQSQGSVLDIACNDGTQLDKFLKRGWKTYGVDPAKNLAPISSSKGHQITVGFWGLPETTEKIKQQQSDFDIIIAQNVFAHVPNPRNFLLACKDVMSDTSRLYIQTSQADIFQTGEFDTIYHEHLSFFTIRSMRTLVESCSLHLDSVERVSVHGSSYLFLINKNGTGSVETQIKSEEEIYQKTNPILYRSQVLEKKSILSNLLNGVQKNGYTVVGFGASAKGNTLLNFIRDEAALPEYIIDENTRKQNRYTPGAQIQVLPYSKLVEEKRAVAILVLAWNFLEEIKMKVSQARVGKPTLIIVPFPDPTLLVLKNGSWKVVTNFDLTPVKSDVKTVLISHFYNEEFLLPYWIMHHAPYFDHAVLIDYDSTDRSREIIEKLAPKTWKVVTSRNRIFDAVQVDAEVRDIEKSFPDDYWRVTLNTTEFMIWPRFKEELEKTPASISAYKISAQNIVGDDSIPLNPELPLVQQRNQPSTGFDYSRYIHRRTNNNKNLYSPGRHIINIPSIPAPRAMMFKYLFSPWPEVVPRKLQIAARQSKYDITHRLGYHHQWDKDQLEKQHAAVLSKAEPSIINPGFNLTDLQLLRREILYEHLGTYL